VSEIVVAALQLDLAWGDKRANFERVRRYAKRAKDEGAALLVLPEMFATGFLLDPAITAEGEGGETAAFLSGLAVEHGMAVVGGYVRRLPSGKGANLAVAYDAEGRALAEYAKVHLVTALKEKEAHEPGDGPRPFSLLGARMACFVCYDLRFPELFRLEAARTDVSIVIASWPSARQRHWDLLLPARAVENQQFVVGVNRVGRGGGLEFQGGTAIYAPNGDALAFGGAQEGLVVAGLELELVAQSRAAFPALDDRRIY
jgi:omega-amidase